MIIDDEVKLSDTAETIRDVVFVGWDSVLFSNVLIDGSSLSLLVKRYRYYSEIFELELSNDNDTVCKLIIGYQPGMISIDEVITDMLSELEDKYHNSAEVVD